MHEVQELVRLHRMGTGAREVARLLGISPNTERGWRRRLDEKGLLEGDVCDLPDVEVLDAAVPRKKGPQQVSSVSDQEPRIRELFERGAGPKAIYDRLRMDDPDFGGSYYAVKRLCAKLDRERPVEPEAVAIPVQTAPGSVGQVDFGYAGMLVDPDTGKQRRAWLFVMVLGFSRHMFAKLVWRQDATTWQQLHVEAFQFFGGVPQTIVPDNLKSAVVRAVFGLREDPQLCRSYREVARHYGFKVDPAPPRAPTKKGKVERMIRYVKRNALATMAESLDIRAANKDLHQWLVDIAGQRLHASTGRAPAELFEQAERAELLDLPAHPFIPVVWKQAKVHRDSHVVFEGALYSVPWRLLGRSAWVRADPHNVYIYVDDTRVAQHRRLYSRGRSTEDAHLPMDRRDLRHRDRPYWEQRARQVGPRTGELVCELFDDEDVLSPLRRAQCIVTLLEGFPTERAENTAKRARHFGIHDYPGIKRILTNALDLEPLPEVLPFPEQPSTYRFNRPVQELLDRHIEGSHG